MSVRINPATGNLVLKRAPSSPDGDERRKKQKCEADERLQFQQKLGKWKVGPPVRCLSGGEAVGVYGRVVRAGTREMAVVKFQSPGRGAEKAQERLNAVQRSLKEAWENQRTAKNPEEKAWADGIVKQFQKEESQAKSAVRLAQAVTNCAKRELEILGFLFERRPRHIVRQYDTAVIEGKRYATLLEYVGPDLYEKYLCPHNPNRVQATLGDVERLGRQFMEALIDLKEAGILHADLKPKNCGEKDGQLCIFDFGLAQKVAKKKSSSRIYSDCYRPPEVTLRMGTEFSGDMWAVGCILFGLITGQCLIPHCMGGKEKVDFEIAHLYIHRFVRGVPEEQQPLVTKEFNQKLIQVTTSEKYTIPARLENFKISIRNALENEDPQKVSEFTDLLEQMLQLHPSRRIKPEDALAHPFFSSDLNGADLSLRLKVEGTSPMGIGMRILVNDKPELEICDLRVAASCYHLPKSEEYRIEYFSSQHPEQVLKFERRPLTQNATCVVNIGALLSTKPNFQRRLFGA
jgi:serine/threonine protein kinase